MNLSKNLVFLFSLCFINLYAQDAVEKKGSISDQFDYIIRKSTNFNEKGQTYEVVKLDLLLSVKAHALDSINLLQSKLETAKSSVSPLEQEIDTLKINLSNSQKSLAILKQEKDDMVLLGMSFSKANYSLVMWSVIAFLFITLLFFIFRFKNSNAITKSTKIAYDDLEKEFEDHRRVALEREQKAMRQLQDELNKHKKD